MKPRLLDIQKNATQIGPFERDTVERMLHDGILQPGDLFREVGQQAWRPLTMLTESPVTSPGSNSSLKWFLGLAAAGAVFAILTIKFSDVLRSSTPTSPAEPVTSLEPTAKPAVTPSSRPNPGQEFRAQAQQGDALHQALLADALLMQGWTDEQFKEAVEWAEKSAAQNHPLGKAIAAETIVQHLGRLGDSDEGRVLGRDNAVAVIAGAEHGPPAWMRWAALAPQRWCRTYPEAFENPEELKIRKDHLLRQAAEAGYAQAAVALAQDIRGQSKQPPEKNAETLAWLRKVADANYPPAIHELARLTREGLATEQDLPQAVALYQKAADFGWGWSHLELAILHHAGTEITSPSGKFSATLDPNVWGANPTFAAEVFQRFQTGTNLPRNEAEAEKWLRKLPPPNQALAIASHIRSLISPDDRERPIQLDEGEKWLARLVDLPEVPPAAADENNAASLGVGQEDSFASPPRKENHEESVKWLTRAALLGSLKAMHSLGSYHHTGYMVGKDKATALSWYQRAANTGDATSIWYLAMFYGKENELSAAAKLYRKALDGGEQLAIEPLARILAAGGDGLPRDDAEATILFRRAATRAQFRSFNAAASLSWRLRKGLGTPLHPGEVAEWDRKLEQAIHAEKPERRGFMLTSTARIFAKAPFLDKEEEYRWWRRAADEGDSTALRMISLRDGTPAEETKAIDSLHKLAAQTRRTRRCLRYGFAR